MRQEDLAAAVGVSKSSVANWESGKHFPKRKLGAVEAALGVRLDDEPEPDVLPEGLRDAIRDTIPDAQRAALVEQVVEAALRGEELPGVRRRRAVLAAPAPPARGPPPGARSPG